MQVYKAAKYIRLSYTDDKSNESNSVGNQRKLIEDFVSRHPGNRAGFRKGRRWVQRGYL